MIDPKQLAAEIAILFGGNGLSTTESICRTEALLAKAAEDSNVLFKQLQSTCDSMNRQISDLQSRFDELHPFIT